MERILEIKKKKAVYIIAHYYQSDLVQDIADFVGDSYAMAVAAKQSSCATILVAGVDFMAESAAILCPDKTILTPETAATCPMANSITVSDVIGYKEKHPDSIVVTYVNTPAEIKAVSDICCTSSNALKIIQKLPDDRRIFFIPDENLAEYLVKKSGRKIDTFPSFCPIHNQVRKEAIQQLKGKYPLAKVLAHPECKPEVVAMADYVGSTGGILNYSSSSETDTFIIATECGIIHPIKQANPQKSVVLATENLLCPNMKSITLEKVLNSLELGKTIIKVPEDIRLRAVKALEKMIEYSS